VVTKHERFVWVFDREQNVAEVFNTRTGANISTIDLNKGGPAGLAPDLAGRSPSGSHIFVSLRGPNPLSGDPHLSTGSTPGLGVIQVTKNGKNGKLKSVIPIHNIDADRVERADAHGIGVRLKETPRSQGGDTSGPEEEEDEDKEDDKNKPSTKK
jgi:hypothetical protein